MISRRIALLGICTMLCTLSLGPLGGCSSSETVTDATSDPPGSTGSAATAAPATGALAIAVGRVDGTEAYVAVLSDATGRAVVYLCDGEQVFQYLDGRIDGAALVAEDGLGSTATATMTEGVVEGTTTLPDGTTHAFRAEPAVGDAGFWWLNEELPDGVDYGGWIRLADGSMRGRSGRIQVKADKDVAISGSKIDDGSGGGSGASSAGRSTTTAVPSGTVIVNGCSIETKAAGDVVIKGNKIDDSGGGGGSGDVVISGTKINEAPPANAKTPSNIEPLLCGGSLKVVGDIVVKSGKIAQN